MPFKGLFSRAIYPVVMGCGALLAYDASAQSAAPASADTQELVEIVVTGSFFAQPTTTNSKALEVLNSDDIAKSPQPNLGLMLSALPAMDGSIVTGNSNDENNNTAAGINLRGLGPRATLVLLNGQRQVPSAANGGQDSFIVDVDGIVPQVLVDRIDVYKDGASALYGSDAVGGVVNFITRKNLNGIVFDENIGDDTNGNRKNGHVGVGFGSESDNTKIIGGVEFSHQDQIQTRDVFGQSRISEFGQTSGFASPGTFFVNGVAHADPLCGSAILGGPPVAGLLVDGKCRQDSTLDRGLIAEENRAVAYLNVEQKFSDSLTLNVEAGAATVHLDRANGVGFPYISQTFTLPTTNPFNPYGAPATLELRQGAAFANDTALTQAASDTYRARVNLDWKISDTWKLSVGGGYGYNTYDLNNSGYSSASRFQAALNCQGGPAGNLCFNPFASAYLAAPGSALANSPALLQWTGVSVTNNNTYSLETEDVLLTGELFKLYNDLPVHLALGAQRRVENTQSVVDPFSQAGDLSFTGAVPNYAVNRTTEAVFAELLFPLASTLDLDLAARTERIVDGTTATNPKLGLNWRPLKSLSFSASIGSSERAPGLLTLLQTSGLGGVANDPITHSAQNGFAVLYLPSKGLSPEKSTNWNLGTTFSPMTPVGQFDLTADIWSIDFKDLITTENANTLDLTDPTSPAIQRSPTGQIQLITLPGYFNANEEKLRGVDFDFRDTWTFDVGELWAGFRGTWMEHGSFTADGSTTNLVGSYNDQTSLPPLPKWKTNAAVGWKSKADAATLSLNYTSQLTEGVTGLNSEVASFTTVDLSASHQFDNRFAVYFGVTNLANKEPPAQGNSIFTANGLAYDLRGRVLQLGARQSF